ncbi:MAG: hypothetical protein ABI416_16575 [Ginsengibacter sp.]
MKKYFCLLLVPVIVSACYSPRYIYSPPTQNIPLLTKKNDLQVSGFYAGSLNTFKEKGNYNRGFDLHSAWAVSNHFAIMLNESARWEKNGGNDSFFPNDSSHLSYKRNFTEAGAGYFTSPAENIDLQFQLFAGAAFGASKIYDDFVSNNVTVKKYHYSRVTKFFIQPAVTYSLFKNSSTGLSLRFTAVSFTHIRTNYTFEELDNYILDSIGVTPVFFWEPAVDYTVSFRKFPIKFQLQGSLTILLNHRFVEHRNANVALGAIYNFRKNTRKKPSTSNK